MQTIYAFSYNPSIATGTNTTKTVWRMAYQQPILLYKGTANSIKLVIYNNAQKVVDLTDYDVQVQIVDKDTQEHFVTRTATIDTPANGVATITFTEADLRNLQHRFYHIIARLMPPNDGSTQVAGEILYLDDNYGAFTPVTIEDAWNFDPTNISTTDGNASITFTSIGETPNSFSGSGGNYLRVNTAEDSLEFVEAVTPVLTSVDNIIPSTNNTYYLGNVDHQWHSLYSGNVKVGNITISGSNISTAPSAVNSLILTANRHTITFSDNSVGNQGIGAVMQFDDTSGSPGPRFETWYGNVATPSDPPGQHSLDIYAADANSYVEFASHDSNTFMGVDAVGAFIYTNWLVNKNHSWYFGADGNFRLPNDGKISNNNGNAAVLFNANNITVVTNDADGSTIHTSSFTESGGLTLDGDLTPVGDAVHSLGTPSNQWKDLYVSNSTIYLGGVPVSVDAGGNLLVNGNTVSGGGAANTGNIIFVDNSITSTNTNENIVLDPNGTGYVNVNNVLQIIAPNGQVQGGLYTSGDADYLNIAADTGRGLKFFVNLENGGITVHPNGVLATTGQLTTLNPDTDFTIRAVNSTGPVNHDYVFASDGMFNLPNGGIIGVNNSTSLDVSYIGDIKLSNSGGDLIFTGSGSLTIPGTIVGNGIHLNADLTESYAYLNLPNNADSSTDTARLGNDNGNVEIVATNQTTSISSYWRFRNDGNLYFPDGTSQSTAFNLDNIDVSGNTISSINTNGDIILDPNGTGGVTITSAANNWVFTNSGYLTLPGNGYQRFESSGGYVGLFADASSGNTGIELYQDNAINAKVGLSGQFNIQVNAGEASLKTWTFDNNGSLSLPGILILAGDSGQHLESSAGNVAIVTDANTGSNNGIAIDQNNSLTAKIGLGGHIDLVVNSGDASQKTWAFGLDGNASFPGDLTVAGNITIQGGTTVVNTADLTVEDSIINLHSQANLAPWTQDDGRDIGIAFHYYKGADKHAYLVWQNDTSHLEYYSEGTETSGVISGTLGTIHANIFSANVATGTAPFIVKSTTQVANLNAATAGTAGTVTAAAQPNITSLGTLTALDVNAQANATIFKSNIATGTAPFIVTSTTQVANLNVAAAGTATTAGTVTTAAQPNITSVGTLSSLDVNAQANATIFKSNIATGTAPFIVSSTTQVANLNVATAGTATTAGTVTTAAQPNITSVGTLTGLTVSGTIDATSSANVALGAVGNVHITGGTNGYVLSTDGSGNLSWVAQSGGGGGSTGNITFTTATISTSGTNENMTLDPNGTGNVSVVGGMTVTANITSPIFTSNIATGTAPFVVTSTTQVANLNVAQAGQLINGNSNVSITANSNVSIYVTGNATARAVFTSTGANIAGTANITGAVSMLSTLSVTSNANVGNIGAATAVITTAANVPLIQNGTSNIAIASGANVTISSAGTANVLTITSTGANIAGTANITGAVTMGSTLAVTGNITTSGSYGNISGANVVTANTMVTTSTTFAGLPAAATAGAGARGFITDANTTTFASQVSGGGANALPVFSNGTNWYVG